MRIGVFFESGTQDVGAFNQSLSTVQALSRAGASTHDIIVFTHLEDTRAMLRREGIEPVFFKHRGYGLIDRWSSTVVGYALLHRLRKFGFRRIGRHLDALLDDKAIDLVIFNNCESDIPLRVGDHPFIVSVWDLDRPDYPEFPESFRERAYERVVRYHPITLPRALAIIANSRTSARRISALYNIDPDRIVVMPFMPSPAVRRHVAGHGTATVQSVSRKYALPSQYVFYPSFLAFHKNGLYLLEALVDLDRRFGIKLDAVFCGGGPADALDAISRQVRALGLEGRVKLIGKVASDDVPALYEGAIALTIPSYFGPINLPLLEAIALGCPVVCSDLQGCQEQMGDAALYCDLSNPSSLADHLASLVREPGRRERLIEAGRLRSAELAKVDYDTLLAPVLSRFDYIRRRWAWPET